MQLHYVVYRVDSSCINIRLQSIALIVQLQGVQLEHFKPDIPRYFAPKQPSRRSKGTVLMQSFRRIYQNSGRIQYLPKFFPLLLPETVHFQNTLPCSAPRLAAQVSLTEAKAGNASLRAERHKMLLPLTNVTHLLPSTAAPSSSAVGLKSTAICNFNYTSSNFHSHVTSGT